MDITYPKNNLIVRCKNTAGTALGGSGETLMPFATETIDTHAAWATDTFTAPFSGYYRYSCRVGHASFGSTYGGNEIRSKKNGNLYGAVVWGKASATATADGIQLYDVVYLAKGDTLKFYYFNAGSAQSLYTNDGTCGITIESID